MVHVELNDVSMHSEKFVPKARWYDGMMVLTVSLDFAVDVKLLEGALATIRHARWFEENAFHTRYAILHMHAYYCVLLLSPT